ncbi:Cucumisin [Glycine max]|nr:Cucumisin [Glycine max]
MDNVVSVFPNRKSRLQTTRSWDFIGVSQQIQRTSLERDIIVGVIDSGLWPESKSFSDEGFGPPPSKWKGSCHNFTCNKKIIGAKYFNIEGDYAKEDSISPRDVQGHGSHTASTIAGNLVKSSSLLGFASGTARGGVPSARIAIYKVCWIKIGCPQAETLAAFDEAIADGVDIISISTGLTSIVYIPYFQSAFDIGSFHAMKRGILTSKSADNSGPGLSSITTYSPWILSVAASTIGRKFLTKVQLGNGMGVSINTFDLKNKMFPLVYAGDVPNTADGYNSSTSRFCYVNSVDKHLVKGKIVLCDGNASPKKVGDLSGAAGMLLGATDVKDAPFTYALPTAFISLRNFKLIHSYMVSLRNSTATIFRSDEDNDDSQTPFIVSFSSRGPNPLTPNTLKPDLAAPGVNILAAWSPVYTISEFKGDKRAVQYNIESGTSMACPHVSAAAAYVKSFHPNWSPAMIKSALMTTATPMSPTLNPDAEFAYGAGLINPLKAANPGLVYDISEADYVKFLCGEGYTDEMLRVLTKDHSRCSKHAKKEAVYDLNLPSLALYVNVSSFSRIFHRTVTNVGLATSSYKAKVVSPSLIDIQVKPNVLSFTSIGQKKSFSVIIEGNVNPDILSASLVWDDGTFQVRSPIVVHIPRMIGSDFEPEAILHSYKKSFNGFVIKLTEEEAERMAEMDTVVSVFPNRKNHLHTTRSWDFLGVSHQIQRTSLESDIIEGVIDTGVWPESESFTDKGITCRHLCSKVIGVKYFNIKGVYAKDDIKSPRDAQGHGSHTVSTIAGNLVKSASLLGFASGTARGGVPSARLAIYKTCWKKGCLDCDVLAAFDESIADGVDIISVSAGPPSSQDLYQYFQTSYNIGSFHAMKRGILTSNSAGNSGPGFSSMLNYPPRILSVAAGTISRKFLTKVQLGNGMGVSINTFDLKNKMFPMVYAGDVPNTAGGYNSSTCRLCYDNTVDKHLGKGKIVLCDGFASNGVVRVLSGAAGMLVGAPVAKDLPWNFALPAAFLSLNNIQLIYSYMISSRS